LRNDFRSRVQDWDGGHFRVEFSNAFDLADLAASALVALLTDSHRATKIAPRRSQAGPTTADLVLDHALVLPQALIEAVANRSALLYVGAGMSLAAGMPSAAAFTAAMVDVLKASDPDYAEVASAGNFNAVASDVAAVLGPDALSRTVEDLINPVWATPTYAHGAVSQLFDSVLTTNYDRLLESSWDHEVLSDEIAGEQLPKRYLVNFMTASTSHLPWC
jgi:hypothetical protein